MINSDTMRNMERILHWIISSETALVVYISELKNGIISFILLWLHRTLFFGNISQELEGFGLSGKERCKGSFSGG